MPLCYSSLLKEEPHPRHEGDCVGLAAFLPGEVGGVEEIALVVNADVGRELPRYLVAQAQAEFDTARSRADPQFTHLLYGHIHFCRRLKDQSLGNEQFVLRLEPDRKSAV